MTSKGATFGGCQFRVHNRNNGFVINVRGDLYRLRVLMTHPGRGHRTVTRLVPELEIVPWRGSHVLAVQILRSPTCPTT